MKPFAITRPDGRSNADVVCDLVSAAPVGHVFDYDSLAEALSHPEKTFGRRDVLAAISKIQSKISKTTKRALRNVRGTGYRICQASEHREVANWRRDRAAKQIERGVVVLRNVRWDELNEQQRLAHEGTLLLMSGLSAQQKAQESRIDRLEALIQTAIKNQND